MKKGILADPMFWIIVAFILFFIFAVVLGRVFDVFGGFRFPF